ncbi:heptaprenyl diphosphate synthase subunit I [Anaerocolumna cellulosilytica]|uniref:Heptaprenyl diphosphate synthase subunit I n=1 Tax=Anaerocolumna cellulosilytica TaxID=433286 RepID=A0A6S6RD83_9FIRM|nr:Gx transporter family protein [Anaerocolumna cellulosilytica]MBB5195198.1 heptaprenyl diphosphate synthase [Anaerocolumna cellulosilytica]BCJ96671.1 heptaprenyl diphosphate synthase subunit I [Anaerocolumna cellulosilytica]
MKNTTAVKVAFYGMFVALAFIFSYIEAIIPFPVSIAPGVKLGLANIVVLMALYAMGAKEALAISCLRIILVGFTFGNLFSIIYSLSGGILSWITMSLLKRSKLFSIVGVSIVGGISHNLGQIIVAAIILETSSIAYYFPILMIAGIVTGVVIGVLGIGLLKVQKKIFNIY